MKDAGSGAQEAVWCPWPQPGSQLRAILAELLAAMPEVGVDADFQRQDDHAVARDVFD
jgi:hypothetical protein